VIGAGRDGTYGVTTEETRWGGRREDRKKASCPRKGTEEEKSTHGAAERNGVLGSNQETIISASKSKQGDGWTGKDNGARQGTQRLIIYPHPSTRPPD
jgi:hypothetical protein